MSVERLQRKSVSFAATTGRFVLKDKNFTQQYNHMYCKRQLQMRPHAQRAAILRWGEADGAAVAKIINAPLDGAPCVVIGMLYKDMKLKPCVLDEYKSDYAVGGALEPLAGGGADAHYVSDDDRLILEDDSGRVALRGARPGALPVAALAVQGVAALAPAQVYK